MQYLLKIYGELCVEILRDISLVVGKKSFLFFIIPLVGVEVVWQKDDFSGNVFDMKAVGVSVY